MYDAKVNHPAIWSPERQVHPPYESVTPETKAHHSNRSLVFTRFLRIICKNSLNLIAVQVEIKEPSTTEVFSGPLAFYYTDRWEYMKMFRGDLPVSLYQIRTRQVSIPDCSGQGGWE